MSLAAAYGPKKIGLSFELFPPKSAEGEEQLYVHVAELVKFRPHLITCTYGAGGSTRDKTLAVVSGVKQRFGGAVAAHLTCVGSTIDQLRDYLADAQKFGVDHIVALRGDPPRGVEKFQPLPGGFRYASELVELIRREYPQFGIAVAGYPETHQDAPNADADLANLKRKVDAGADIVITQLFYQNADFWRFRERCENLGIRVPIVPGVLPITNFAQVQRITSLCKAALPEELCQQLSAATTDADQFELGVSYATRQVDELVRGGVPGVHFYVLNKSQAAARVLRDIAIG